MEGIWLSVHKTNRSLLLARRYIWCEVSARFLPLTNWTLLIRWGCSLHSQKCKKVLQLDQTFHKLGSSLRLVPHSFIQTPAEYLWAIKCYVCMIQELSPPFACQPFSCFLCLSRFWSLERWHDTWGKSVRQDARGVLGGRKGGGSLFCVLPHAAKYLLSHHVGICVSEYLSMRVSYLLSSLSDRDRLQRWRSGAASQVFKGKVAPCDSWTN